MGQFVSYHTQNIFMLETHLYVVALGEASASLVATKQEMEDPSCYSVLCSQILFKEGCEMGDGHRTLLGITQVLTEPQQWHSRVFVHILV